MPEYKEKGTGEYFGPDNQDSVPLYGMAASGARALLLWSRQQTEGYNDVNIYNMTSSWRDGLAFCAIIHRYRPDLIEFDKLSKDNIIQNNELAFDICERLLDIPSILDVGDMVENAVPDKLSVLTFVSQLFNYFKDKIPANQVVSTRMNASIKSKNEAAMIAKGKRVSQSKAKRFSSALKNVFKSETKDDRLKVEYPFHKQPSTENLKSAPESNEKKTDVVNSPRQTSIGTICSSCHTKVYILERLVVEHKLFHRACCKCSKCGAGLRPGTYTYCIETEEFYCIYACMGDFKRTQEEIRIKLQPISDKVFDVLEKESQTSSTKRGNNSPWSSDGNTLAPFSIVKKNMISIGSLDKSFEDLSQRRKKSSSNRKDTKEKIVTQDFEESKKSRSHNTIHQPGAKIEVEVKRENGKVKSCVKISPVKNRQQHSDEIDNSDDHKKPQSTWKEKAKGRVGLNDAYIREEEERPQEGSVNKLRMKFLKIDDMIEDKHRQKLAKKKEIMQREIGRVVPTWNEEINGKNGKEDSDSLSTTHPSLDSDCDSIATSSGQSSSSHMEDKNAAKTTEDKTISTKQNLVLNVDELKSKRRGNQRNKKKANLSIQESSSSSTPSTPSPTNRTIPIIVQQTADSDNEPEQRGRSVSQTSSTSGALSPGSDSCFSSETPNSPGGPWLGQNSMDETKNDDLPKMSIIIAQESSSTKINSRYFTVETCESKDRNVIMEDKEIETVDIEGEFKFDDDGNKYTTAQQNVLRSFKNCKITRDKSDLVKEEDVFLSPLEIIDELNALGTLLTELEKRGVKMEMLLRQSLCSERSIEKEDELMREWLTLVQEKNIILRRESELIYLLKFHQYEDRYLLVECELRALLSIKDDVKTVENVKRERELMSELFGLVQRRSSIVDKLEEDKFMEKQEDETLKLDIDGRSESWDQKQDYTKVAFSRFYC
ncbi:F-actin-monooxygenase MICAL3 [Exaiptasia diaphana]|uniref:Uncharacterized protein n=1 Tax=Exaiptasia diaphana TaxID=2652724 RepID=A0A913XBQ6_EXADI|nr:F-actin-monooxygenase MICAL3 [Exaiptasia diaphana]